MWRGTGRAGVLAAVVVALGASSGCRDWDCDFESHGACIEFTEDPPDLDDARRRVEVLLALELPYWGLANLGDWRIQFRNTSEYTCYLATRNDGCTDYIDRTISIRIPPDSRGCFEASELLHELGHYALGDPMHSNSLWRGVDAQFAATVWDRPDAAPECVERYHGIYNGVWQVSVDSF